MNKLKILIVDDEQPIVSSMAQYFSKKGYDVLGVSSPEDALVALAQESFDVVITDLYMQPVTGFEIADIVRKRCPKTLLMAMSGRYASDEVNDLDVDYFLEKPFLYKDIAQRLKERFALKGA
ncbi:MAG: response regulator [Thermodesulfovibrionales bacterium]|nr:response regulator [Thermodesulfovibrionales bacterium]